MDRRFAVAVVLSFLVLFVFQVYFAPKNRHKVTPVVSDTTRAVPGEAEIKSVGGAPPPNPASPESSLAAGDFVRGLPQELVQVHTAQFDLQFTNQGGRLATCLLKDYKAKDGTPVGLLTGKSAGELDLLLERGKEFIDLGEVSFTHHESTGPDSEQVVTFETTGGNGIHVTKTYTVPSSGYLMRLDVAIAGNETIDQYRLAWLHGLPVVEDPKQDHLASGTVVMAGKDVTTLRPSAFRRVSEREVTGNVRWAGVRNKYFIAAMIPPSETSSRVVGIGNLVAGDTGVELVMPLQNGSGSHSVQVYLGPLDYTMMKPLGLGLEHAVNLGYKFVRPLSQVLLVCMEWLYKFVPNFGIVIIIISIVAKLAFYPLTRSSMRSMRALQHLQPKMEELRTKHKKDPARMQKEMMALYKEHKVNPMGGCWPILIQMPVFIALYAVLANCIELRQAPFFGWINDLSTPDVLFRVGAFPIHVLPVIMFGTTILQQKLTPMTDPRQKMMGYMMPVMMLFIFYSFPAGLNLYWTMNNVLTVAQQWNIHREAEREKMMVVAT
jgi:YidC/Oxa1 family membrane protein insertase